MSKYRVSIPKVIWLGITVEANDEDSAIERAFDEAPSGLCAHCSGWGQNWGVDEDEWGGIEGLHENFKVTAEVQP